MFRPKDNDRYRAAVCFYCNRELELIYDHSCIDCRRLTCDNCCEICEDWDCGLITCVRCIESHMQTEHPLTYAGFLLDFPLCG